MADSLGLVKIFFGKVKTVQDTTKLYRCQISVDNYTEKIPVADLPWYFPWYGLNYLPEEGDIISVIVFDDNFSTAFYGRKIELNKSELSDEDYLSYLEIYNRNIDDKKIQLSYTKSKGIEFINGESKTVIELDKITWFQNDNSIEITNDKIILGNQNQEAAILGNKGVDHLNKIITHQQNTINNMMQLFGAIATACTTPFTKPIQIALTASMSPLSISLGQENGKLVEENKTIQSKKTFIE